MPEITSSGAVNRHITEYLTTDKRVKQYRCKTLQNPDYYYDGSVFGAVDVAHKLDTSTVQAGSIWLRDKAIVSVGTKQADDAYKIVGLRPDENQSGSESFEISIESIEINGKPQTINLRDRMEVSSITTKFGDNLYVQRARQRCRVMVEATNADEGFKIALRLHLKGLTVKYRDDLDEYWMFNDKGEFRFRLGKPYLVDPATMNPIHGELGNPYPQLVKHSLTEIGKGEYLYAKEPTGAFGKVKLPDRFLIDADTVYSSTADGWVQYAGGDWTTAQAATVGTSVKDNSSYDTAFAAWGGASPIIDRSFFYFDTHLEIGTITVASALIYGYSWDSSTVCLMLGTQADTLVKDDYDAFTGNYFGLKTPWSTSGYNTISFNAEGLAGINQTGITKICGRDYVYDYLNSDPGSTLYRCGCYYANQSGTDYDTYLSIVTAAAAATFIKDIMRHHFIPAFIGGN